MIRHYRLPLLLSTRGDPVVDSTQPQTIYIYCAGPAERRVAPPSRECFRIFCEFPRSSIELFKSFDSVLRTSPKTLPSKRIGLPPPPTLHRGATVFSNTLNTWWYVDALDIIIIIALPVRAGTSGNAVDVTTEISRTGNGEREGVWENRRHRECFETVIDTLKTRFWYHTKIHFIDHDVYVIIRSRK